MWKSAYPCRCSKCRARKTFRKHPESYRHTPHCYCGGTYAVDQYRLHKEHKRVKCNCDLWWFPHRIGSHKQAIARFEAEYEARYGEVAA